MFLTPLFVAIQQKFAERKRANEADARAYEEELQAETCQLVSEGIAELHHETSALQGLLASDYYALGIGSVCAGKEENPWADPRERIHKNNRLFELYQQICNNQTQFTQRAGAPLIQDYFNAYREFSEARDALVQADEKRGE
jgi:phosphoglycerate-specific signal transduction histidine kinase